MISGKKAIRKAAFFAPFVLVLGAMWLTSKQNYLLFHTLAETFSVAVAVAIFMLAWNARRFLASGYFLFLGIAYIHVASLDMIHTLSYKGLGIFGEIGSNPPTQLWIAARYLESVSLLLAPIFVAHKLKRPAVVIGIFSLIVAGILVSVFYSGNVTPRWFRFPNCYVEGQGLTLFKIASEYIICVILLAGLVALLRLWRKFDRRIAALVSGSIVLTILAEMCFTQYVHVYGPANMLGHLFKVSSFYLIYEALIVTGLSKPYELLFRELRETRDQLEKRVRERTEDLVQTVETLEEEARERRRLQGEVLSIGERERSRIGRDLHDSIGQMLSGISCLSHVLRNKLTEKKLSEASEAATIQEAASDTLALTRSIATGLNPIREGPDNLMIALQELAAYTRTMFSIRCVFECEEPVPIEDHVMASQIYRIAQEAVSNAARHAEASNITIRLFSCDHRVVMTTEDDGVGIPGEVPEGMGLGLRTMQYRAESIGASLDIESSVDGGTLVRCRIAKGRKR